MRRACVTGASGLLGSAALRRAARPRRRGRRPDAAIPSARARPTPRSRWHAWNPTLERPPGERPRGRRRGRQPDRRVASTSAGPTRPSSGSARAASAATKNLVDALARRRPAARACSSASRPSATTATAATRSSTSRREPGTDVRGRRSCVAWEAAAREAERSACGWRSRAPGSCSTRTSGLLSSCSRRSSSASAGRSPAATSTCPGSTSHDEVRAPALGARRRGRSRGVYNATAPQPVTNAEFSKALGRALGRPAVLPVPKLALKARFGSELGDVIAGGQRVVPRRALDGGFEFAHPELEPALRSLLPR